MKTIYELDFCECRWPIGEHRSEDDEQLFCGGATAEGLSYCPTHGRMSTADGSDPRARAPQSGARFPGAHRGYLDREGPRWQWAEEHEPDLVQIFEKQS